MKAKKDLQKFTKTEEKINHLLKLKQVLPEDLETLSEQERYEFNETLSKKFYQLSGTERDAFLRKIDPVTNDQTRNQLWEYNQSQITWAISDLMQEYGRMPSQTELAEKTGLSRQTINKHLKGYSSHQLFIEQQEQFNFMAAKVLTKVFSYAVKGDMRAAKLYLNATGAVGNSNKTLIQNQNNYIQINNTVLSQETIKQLNPEQLNAIEEILKTALPIPIQNE
jgi:hypothetical protein